MLPLFQLFALYVAPRRIRRSHPLSPGLAGALILPLSFPKGGEGRGEEARNFPTKFIFLLPLCLLFLLFSLASAPAQDAVSKEYQIKAAYLYNFAKFVEWPADSFTNSESPLVIGVYGQNPFGPALDTIAQAHQINGRPIIIRSVTNAADIAGVHLMFIGAAEDNDVAEILVALKNTAILTVGESRKFRDAGGVIDFVREADKVRFEISEVEAERHGLKISAQLLKLATAVHKSPEARP